MLTSSFHHQADVLSDLLLIVAPLRLIQQMSAVDGTRRRLMIIFSTSIVTTYVKPSIAAAYQALTTVYL